MDPSSTGRSYSNDPSYSVMPLPETILIASFTTLAFTSLSSSYKTLSVWPSVAPGISRSRKIFKDGFELISMSQALFFLSIKMSKPKIWKTFEVAILSGSLLIFYR